MSSPSFKDRTPTWAAMVARSKGLQHLPAAAAAATSSGNAQLLPAPVAVGRSSFPAMAAQLAREIAATSSKLERLTRLAKKTGVFDNQAQEMEQLTAVVKSEIQSLKRRLEALGGAPLRRNKQAEQYSDGVMTALQMQLASTTGRFQSVLSQRTVALAAQQHARREFTGALTDGAALLQMLGPDAGSTQLQSQTQTSPGGDETAPLLMVVTQEHEAEQRAAAAQHLEGHINELHQIFTQMTTLVATHHDLTLRIDQNVDDTLINAEGAQNQIIKYWRSVSSNRWFMFKLFAILLAFVVIFLVFFV